MSIDDSAHLNAVDTLYSDHHDWLVRWLRSRVGCAHNAAD
ncbi:MAG: RNA polymerase subunit sigma, partial [Nitrosomonas sp. PRO5]|nr:RNA polymerase subunit sigma [Nitrosomonas sp. PRO5]